MKKVIFTAIIALILVSCNKDQSSANKLEGKWNATSFIFNNAGETSTYNSVTEDNQTFTFEFGDCKIKKEDNCSCNWRTVDYTGYVTELVYNYTVQNDGEEIFLDDPSSTIYDETWTITELTKDALEMNKTNTSGATVFMILEKMN